MESSSPPPPTTTGEIRPHRSTRLPSSKPAAASTAKPWKASAKTSSRIHFSSSKIAASHDRHSDRAIESEIVVKHGESEKDIESYSHVAQKQTKNSSATKENKDDLHSASKEERKAENTAKLGREEVVVITDGPLETESSLNDTFVAEKQKSSADKENKEDYSNASKEDSKDEDCAKGEKHDEGARVLAVLQEKNRYDDCTEKEKKEDSQRMEESNRCAQFSSTQAVVPPCQSQDIICMASDCAIEKTELEHPSTLTSGLHLPPTKKSIGLGNSLEVLAAADPSSPPADKDTVYRALKPVFSASSDTTLPTSLKGKIERESELQQNGQVLVFTEHLDTEQEGFLFPKDVSGLSNMGAAVVAASDFKPGPSAVVETVCQGISALPSSDASGFVEVAMAALAKNVLVESPLSDGVQYKASPFRLKCPRQALLMPLLLVSTACIVYFLPGVLQDDMPFLTPT